jgi:hypothetical protein
MAEYFLLLHLARFLIMPSLSVVDLKPANILLNEDCSLKVCQLLLGYFKFWPQGSITHGGCPPSDLRLWLGSGRRRIVCDGIIQARFIGFGGKEG